MRKDANYQSLGTMKGLEVTVNAVRTSATKSTVLGSGKLMEVVSGKFVL
jgi:hypothetical protein